MTNASVPVEYKHKMVQLIMSYTNDLDNLKAIQLSDCSITRYEAHSMQNHLKTPKSVG